MRFLPTVIEQRTGFQLHPSLTNLLELLVILSPVVAAAVLVVTQSERGTLRTFLRGSLRARVAPRWYALALVLFPLLYAGPVAVFLLWSGQPLSVDDQALLLVFDVFTLGIVTNLIETVGWRGYLQEELQSRHSAVGASLAVGVVWGLWHAPLFLVANAPLADLPYGWYIALLVGLSVIFGWVYNETGGSVAVVTLLHSGQNAAIAPVLFALLGMDVDVTPLIGFCTLAVWLVVAFLYSRTNPETLTMGRTRSP